MSLASRIPLLRDIDPFYGWWIIVACVVINHVGAGFIAYGFSVIIDPIQKELDWSTAAIALAFSLRSEVRSLGSPIAGILVDRFGARAMMAVGVLVMGIGCLVLSNVNTLLGFYLASLIISPGHSLANPTIAAVMVAKWFVRWRSRALTLLMLGTGLGGLNAPTMGLLIVRFGWRGALRVLAVLMWVVGLPLAATLKDDPQRAGVLPDGDREQPSPESAGEQRGAANRISPSEEFTLGRALRNRAFWHLLGAFTLIGLGTTPIMTLLVPALLREGFSLQVAVLAAGAIPLVSLPGRLFFGWWGDFIDKKKLLAACFTLQAAGLLLLSGVNSTPLLILFVLIYGSASGGSNPLRVALQADYFGTRAMGSIQGMLQSSAIVDGLIAPVIVGITVDMLGTYRPAWFVLGLCTSLAGPVLFTMPRPFTAPAPVTTPQE